VCGVENGEGNVCVCQIEIEEGRAESVMRKLNEGGKWTTK